MKKTVILAFLAVLAVQLMLGCCICRSGSGPDLDPYPPPPMPPVVVDPSYPSQKFAVLATNLEAKVEDNQNDSDFWYDLVLTYCTLLEHGFQSDDVYVLYGDGNDATFSSIPAYGSAMCGVTGLTMTDYSLQNSTGAAKDNFCNVLCCLSTGFPAELKYRSDLNTDICECLTDSNTGLGDEVTCSQPTGEPPGPAKLRPDDFLFVWVKGHGKSTSCNTTLRFLPPNPHLHDFEVETLLTGLDPKHRALIFETCDAGGWLDNLKNSNTAVAVSSGNPDETDGTCEEKAYAVDYNEIAGDEGDVFHSRFTHGFNAALRHLGSAGGTVDTDDNNLVSIQEGFDEAKKRVNAENDIISGITPHPNPKKYGEVMNPAIQIEDDISSCLFIRLPFPGKDHEVFTKDHPDDNALISSAAATTATPAPTAASPDLWVSENLSCEPKAELVQTGLDHYLCARVHNIGCADPVSVSVTFFVRKCSDTGPVTEITGSIPDLGAAKSLPVPALWPAVATTAGDYCIRAELSAGTDTPIGDLPVEKDNNKAEFKVTVQ